VRKIAFLALLLSGLLFFAACGDAGQEESSGSEETNDTVTTTVDVPTETPAPEQGQEELTEGFYFVFHGVAIHMDQDMAYLLPQLREPLGVFEAPSCAFDGIDRIFGFPGMQVHTYPDDDLDRVHTISILDDSVSTPSGIFLGSGWNEVVAAYGDDYEQEIGMFTFTQGQTTLSFFVENDIVIGITFGLIMG